MTQLTQEQIKTLEDAFASYPEDFPTTSKYASMKGIQEQLEELNGEPGDIFFISKAHVSNEINPGEQTHTHCTMERMKIGEQK